MKKIGKIKKIHLGRRVDIFKSNWALFECSVELTNGKVIDGFIQSDFAGNLIDETSFEPEE
jgi:hypothetical protein